MTSLREKTVLLTGASGSIGSEVARRLAARGARLALSGRREEPLRQLASEIERAGGQPPFVALADLAQPGDAQRLASEVVEALARVDVLINNAGITMEGLIWAAGDGNEARAVFETNLWSPLALVAGIVPGMLERGHGKIVNIGTIAASSPVPRLGDYAASRAALTMATEVMQVELAPRGVRVVEVVFGPIDTPAAQEGRALGGSGRQMRRSPVMGKLGPAADTIVNAVDSDVEGVIFYPRMLGASRRFPGLIRRFSRAAAGRGDLQDTNLRLGRGGGGGTAG